MKLRHGCSTVKPWDLCVTVYYHLKFGISSKVGGSVPFIPFRLFTQSCELRFAGRPFSFETVKELYEEQDEKSVVVGSGVCRRDRQHCIHFLDENRVTSSR